MVLQGDTKCCVSWEVFHGIHAHWDSASHRQNKLAAHPQMPRLKYSLNGPGYSPPFASLYLAQWPLNTDSIGFCYLTVSVTLTLCNAFEIPTLVLMCNCLVRSYISLFDVLVATWYCNYQRYIGLFCLYFCLQRQKVGWPPFHGI